ncbi:MAG TPA: VOC family protein [Chitinophagaceae bacterium]|nr:VOC family protein [Chitinophagaceae bacterium]
MKTKKFIRSGPHLPVKDLRLILNYYRDTLGFYGEWTFGEKDGGIRRDEMRLLFAENNEFTTDINNPQHRLPLIWFVDNIDEVLSEFKGKNIELADDLKTHPYGLREFAFIDINGYYIRIAEGADKE